MQRMRQTRYNRVTPRGNNYTGATGKFDGSFDVKELQSGTGKLSAELNYGEDGFSVSGNADLGNGLGFGLENGRNGMSGSLTILGSTQGTVDGDGNYEANGNFLGEISGQDIIDLNKARADQRLAEENERNPAKSAKDAKNAKEARDDDAKEVGGEEGPSGLVDLAFAGLGVVMSAGAAFLAGGGSSSASPSAPASGQGAAGNGANATVARKPEDEKDGKVKRDGDTTNEPPKKQPTKEELANFKDNIFLNTTRAVTDAYLAKLDAQGVDTTDMRAHAEALRAKGVRDLTASEIQAKREKAANKENPPFKNASSIVPEIKNYTILDNNGKPMKVGIPDSIISRDGDSVEERNSKPFIYIKYDDGSDGIIPNPKFENPDKAKEFLDDIKSGRRQAPAVGDNMQNVHKFGTNILGIQTSDPMHDNQVIWAYLKAKHGIELDSKHPNLMDDPIIKKLAKEDPDLYFKLGNLIAGAVWNDDPDFYFYSQMPGRVKDLPATTRLKLGKENQDKSFPGNKDILASDAKSFWFTHEKLSKEFFQKFDIIRDSFHIRSHFGDLQFLHSMAKEGDNPYDTRNKMLSYSEMMYKIYTNQVDGRTAFFQKAFFGDKSLYTAFKTDDHEALRNRVIGSVMHIIEDSYAGGHTVRDEKTGKISYFQSYETQDPDKHGASDKTKPGQTWDKVQGTDFGREQSEMLLQFAERKPKPASWSEVEAHLKEKVWGFVKIEGKESPEPAHSHPSYKPDSKPKTIKEIAEDELKAIKEKIEKQLKEQKDKIYQQNQIQEQRNVPPTPWYPDV